MALFDKRGGPSLDLEQHVEVGESHATTLCELQRARPGVILTLAGDRGGALGDALARFARAHDCTTAFAREREQEKHENRGSSHRGRVKTDGEETFIRQKKKKEKTRASSCVSVFVAGVSQRKRRQCRHLHPTPKANGAAGKT